MPGFDLIKEHELSFVTALPNQKEDEVALFPDNPSETLLGAHCKFCGHVVMQSMECWKLRSTWLQK